MELLQQPNNTAEIIKAINGSWPLLLIIVIIVFLIFNRKGISKFLSKFNKISGKTPVVELKLEAPEGHEAIAIANQDTIAVNEANDNSVKQIEEEIKESKKDNEEISWFIVYKKLVEGDIVEAEKLLNIMNQKEQDFTERYINDMLFLRFKYVVSKIDTVKELKIKADQAPNDRLKFKGLEFIGDIYSDFKQYDTAIHYYERSLRLTIEDIDIADTAVKLSHIYYLNNLKDKCLPFLYSVKSKLNDTKALSKVYLAIASYFEKDNDKLNRVLALEAATFLDPSDTSTRFSTAYEYSLPNMDMNVMSFVHYEEYLNFKPNDPSVLNNLAVSYNRLDMLGKAATYYKKASESGNTLASSNLANKYIATGLFEEAKQLLNSAKAATHVNENVWTSLKDLADKESKENEKLKEVRDRGNKLQLFLRRFSERYFSEGNINLIELNGSWYQNNGLSITLTKLNPAYYEVKWQADNYNYKVTVPWTNYQNVTGEGERSPVGGGGINKLNVFASSSNDKTSISIMVYDKTDDFGTIYEFRKVEQNA